MKRMMTTRMTTVSKDFLRKSTRLRRSRNSGKRDLISLKTRKRLQTLSVSSKFKVRSLKISRILSNKSSKRLKKRSRISRVKR